MSNTTNTLAVETDGSTNVTPELDDHFTTISVGDKAADLTPPRRWATKVGAVWPHVNLSAMVAATCLAAWMVLFVCGTFVNASTLIQSALNAPQFTMGAGIRFLAGVVCWTWTNILTLCVLSSFLGGIARVWDDKINYREVQFDALTTGFIVFMLFMFEESLMGGRLNPSANPDAQGTYMRLVIVSSLLSFVGSYHPNFHQQLLRKFMDSRDTPTTATTTNKPR